jgi:hypothetical protein
VAAAGEEVAVAVVVAVAEVAVAEVAVAEGAGAEGAAEAEAEAEALHEKAPDLSHGRWCRGQPLAPELPTAAPASGR